MSSKKTTALPPEKLTTLRTKKYKIQSQIDSLIGSRRETRNTPIKRPAFITKELTELREELVNINEILKKNNKQKTISFNKIVTEIAPSDIAPNFIPIELDDNTMFRTPPNKNTETQPPYNPDFEQKNQAGAVGYTDSNDPNATFNAIKEDELEKSIIELEDEQKDINKQKDKLSQKQEKFNEKIDEMTRILENKNKQSPTKQTGTKPKATKLNFDTNENLEFPSDNSNLSPFAHLKNLDTPKKSNISSSAQQTQQPTLKEFLNELSSKKAPTKSILSSKYQLSNPNIHSSSSDNTNSHNSFKNQNLNTDNSQRFSFFRNSSTSNTNQLPSNQNSFSKQSSQSTQNQNQIQSTQNMNQPQPNQNTQRNDNQDRTEGCRKNFLKQLKSIPTFSGETREKLTDFIDTCDILRTFCSNEIEYVELLMQIKIQLRGEARSATKNDVEWETIKQNLTTHFGYLSNRDIINSKLENLRQEPKESLSDYAERTRKLLIEKDRSYNDISADQKSEHNRIARKAFSRGILDSKLRDKMLLRGSNSLEESVSYAIEFDNDNLSVVPNNELFCKFCKTPGHRERDCRKKDQNNSQFGQFISAIQSMNISNQNRSLRNNNNNQNFGGRTNQISYRNANTPQFNVFRRNFNNNRNTYDNNRNNYDNNRNNYDNNQRFNNNNRYNNYRNFNPNNQPNYNQNFQRNYNPNNNNNNYNNNYNNNIPFNQNTRPNFNQNNRNNNNNTQRRNQLPSNNTSNNAITYQRYLDAYNNSQNENANSFSNTLPSQITFPEN